MHLMRGPTIFPTTVIDLCIKKNYMPTSKCIAQLVNKKTRKYTIKNPKQRSAKYIRYFSYK